MQITLQEAKDWLRIDHSDEDTLITGLILASQNYLLTATGKRNFGEQEELAKTFALYLVAHWYEDRDFYNPSPESIPKPMLTMIMTQLQWGSTGLGGDC